jgi:hypothetical protein
MLGKWWQQFLERNKRVLSEVIQIQMDMARKNPSRLLKKSEIL